MALATLPVERLEAADTLPCLFLSMLLKLVFCIKYLGKGVNVYNIGRTMIAVQINLTACQKQSLF
jgi:hypothetical protein